MSWCRGFCPQWSESQTVRPPPSKSSVVMCFQDVLRRRGKRSPSTCASRCSPSSTLLTCSVLVYDINHAFINEACIISSRWSNFLFSGIKKWIIKFDWLCNQNYKVWLAVNFYIVSACFVLLFKYMTWRIPCKPYLPESFCSV